MRNRDGDIRSSVETVVMTVERRGAIIQLNSDNNYCVGGLSTSYPINLYLVLNVSHSAY
ncbi:MAG: hypothetical protein ACTHKA_06185 [Anaerocolumna jejuensis]